MPYRGKKTYRRRKPNRRRYKKKSRYAINTISRSPFPQVSIAKLRYVETIILDPPIASETCYVYSANGIYDCNITGGGHQPMGFDEYMNLYNHYTVIGSKMSANFMGAQSGDKYICGLGVRDSTTLATTSEQFREQGDTVFGYIDDLSGGKNQHTLTRKFSTKKQFGRKSIISVSQFTGTNVSNPNEQAYFHLMVSPADNASDEGAVIVNVFLQFIVAFTEPKLLNLS